MTRSAYLKIGALAAVYLLWLASWFVFRDQVYGSARQYWDQATAAAVTGLVAFHASRRSPSPYPAFLLMQGFSFLLLAVAWVTYGAAEGCRFPDW